MRHGRYCQHVQPHKHASYLHPALITLWTGLLLLLLLLMFLLLDFRI
jgi:hypothetical protein